MYSPIQKFCLTITVVILCFAFLFFSCSKLDSKRIKPGDVYEVLPVQLDGHDYLIIKTSYNETISIHRKDCQKCNKFIFLEKGENEHAI